MPGWFVHNRRLHKEYEALTVTNETVTNIFMTVIMVKKLIILQKE